MVFNWEEAAKKLQAPFEANEIEWRVGQVSKDKTRGQVFAYVSNRAIQNRLDEVFGPNNWKNEYQVVKDSAQYRKKNSETGEYEDLDKDAWLCGISVWDDEKKQWIAKWDGAENTDFEPVKGGLSGSMKRAAVQWGIGRYLYELPEVWVEVEQRGRSFVPKITPTLPDWALPGGAGKPPVREKESSAGRSGNEHLQEESLACAECGKTISKKVADYSARNFGKPLCMDCQNKYK